MLAASGNMSDFCSVFSVKYELLRPRLNRVSFTYLHTRYEYRKNHELQCVILD